MRRDIVPIKAWVELERACKAVHALAPGDPRMILVHGAPGLGKTTAVDRAHIKYGGVYLEASATWSPRVVLEKIADRLGVRVKARDRVSTILDNILESLDDLPPAAVMVIDEFDRVARKHAIVELFREIYDSSGVPLCLVGMGKIEGVLAEIPQFPQRIGQRVEFKKIDLEDAAKIAGLCDVELTDDLIRALWERSSGVLRLFRTELVQAESQAGTLGVSELGVSDLEGI